MKALTDRLEWVRIYFQDMHREKPNPKFREYAIEALGEAIAIAEVLPDQVTMPMRVSDDVEPRAAAKRIINL